MNRDLKIINLFGGPGTGKSTLAAYVFHELKCAGKNVELITEYAKDMVWERRTNVLVDEFYVTAKQHRRIERLIDHGLEVAITDSPLILSCLYQPEGYFAHFEPLVAEIFKSYTNSFNVVLNRGVEYNPLGRYQTADEAAALDVRIHELLKRHSIPLHWSMDVAREGAKENLMREIEDWLK